MRSKINNLKTDHQQQNVNLFKILSHDFAAHESIIFKEVINDLGVKVNYNANSVVIINGGAEQYLEVALKVDN